MHRANRLLDGTDPVAQTAALRAVSEASSVLDAAQRAGLFEGLSGPGKKEARSALAALPASVDAALLAVLRGALERTLPVVLQWKPGSHIELQIWEAVEDDVGHIGVMLITPFARDLRAPG
jgi:hypothetical protein